MERINELIGIIDGINYDGVINDLEVKALQNWLQRNRSIDTSSHYSKIVATLEDVLLDGIITDEEKDKLIYYANMYRENGTNVNEVLNTLYGIIEGIVCDNVLNNLEIENLSNWLYDNAFLSGVTTYDKINDLVIKILEDKIVTEEERNMLMKALREAIIDSKNTLKINHIKHKILNRDNIGIDVIEIIEDDVLVQQIHSSAETQLKRAFISYSRSVTDAEIVFLSLTIIALLNYDGNFYDGVRDTYRDLYSIKSKQEVENLIRSTLGKFQTKEQLNSPRKINVCLRNTIVPLPFLSDFYEFIFDIYKLNFNCTLVDNMREEFAFIYDGLRSSMTTDNDLLELSVTKKTYKLINSTKELIRYSKRFKSIIELSIAVIRIIDREYWSEENNGKSNYYLQVGYDNWIKQYHNSRKVKATGERTKFNSRWEPSLTVSDTNVYLVPPIHKIKDIFAYKIMRCEVRNGDVVISDDRKPTYRQIVGGFEVEFKKIKLDNPLGELSYTVYGDDKVLYDSKDKLHRPAIAFELDGKEIKNNTDYVGEVVFCYKGKNNDIQPYIKAPNYNLGYAVAQLSSVFVFGDFYFNFSSILKPGIFGNKMRHQKIMYENTMFDVYESVKYMMIESKLDAEKIAVSVNGKKYKLTELSYTSSMRNVYHRYVIEIPTKKTGVYEVYAYSLEDQKKLKNAVFYFAIDKSLETAYVKINDTSYQLSVKSDLLKRPVVEYVDINDIPSFTIPFSFAKKSFIYNIDFNIPLYRIDKKSWRSIYDYLWIEDVKSESVLDIYGTKITRVECYEDDLRPVGALQFTKHNRYYTGEIGGIRTFKNNCTFLDMIWADEENGSSFIRCYNKCQINENLTKIEFDQEDNTLLIQPNYIGKGQIGLKIVDRNNNEIFSKQKVTNDDLILVTNLQMNEKYAIEFYERGSGLLAKKNTTSLKTFYKTFYSYKSLDKKNFQIKSATLMEDGKKRIISLQDTYIKFSKKIDLMNYVCDVYQMRPGGISYYMYNISPSDVEILGTDLTDDVKIKITKDDQFLSYDDKKKTIFNGFKEDDNEKLISFNLLIK